MRLLQMDFGKIIPLLALSHAISDTSNQLPSVMLAKASQCSQLGL
jgi:hypothetical protein